MVLHQKLKEAYKKVEEWHRVMIAVHSPHRRIYVVPKVAHRGTMEQHRNCQVQDALKVEEGTAVWLRHTQTGELRVGA